MRQYMYPHRFEISFFKSKRSRKPIREEKFCILAKTDREAMNGANMFGKRELSEKGYDRFELRPIVYD